MECAVAAVTAYETDYHRDNAQNRNNDGPGYVLPGMFRGLARLESFCAGNDLNHRDDRHKEGTGVEEPASIYGSLRASPVR